MSTRDIEHYNGQPLKITSSQVPAGTWQSTLEIDLGRTGCVVFEDPGETYASEEEAREAVLAFAVQNLSQSRIPKITPT